MANNTDALLTPSMPHSPQAEQAVLGSMLIDADCVKEIVPVELQQDIAHVKNDVFYHQTIFTLPFVARNTMTSEIIVVSVSIVASAAAVPSLMRTTS